MVDSGDPVSEPEAESHRGGFGEFGGDGCLTGSVVHESQRVDEIGSVASRAVHSGHSRSLFASLGLQEGLKDLCAKRQRQQAPKDFIPVGLIDKVTATGIRLGVRVEHHR